jgi:hypothetical protein
MAYLSFEDLARAEDQDRDRIGTDTTELIATVDLTPVATQAMLIGPCSEGTGEICYLGEVPVEFYNWSPRRDQFGTDRWYEVTRLEIKSKRGADGAKTRDRILLSEVPPSTCVVAGAELKPGFKGAADEKPLPEADVVVDARRLHGWLESLRFDYWETNQSRLTAAVHAFEAPPVFVEDVRAARDRGVVIGLCRDYDATLQALRASAAWTDLVEKALSGDRRFNWWGSDADYVPLEDEIRVNLDDILELSVRQALAGPNYGVDDDNAHTAALLGQPVMKEAERIFKLHLNRLNKQRHRRNRPLRGTDPDDAAHPDIARETAATDNRPEGLGGEGCRRIAERYGIDFDGACWITGVLLESRLVDHEPSMQDRALRVLARVWNLPKPDRRQDALRAQVERGLAREDIEHALTELEDLVADAVARF